MKAGNAVVFLAFFMILGVIKSKHNAKLVATLLCLGILPFPYTGVP